MNPFRVIPIILISGNDCVKGGKFSNHKYIGDPINIVKIFNDKEVDEIVILDITARKKKVLNWNLIEKLACECRMPFSYGGNINNIEDIKRLNRLGVEKVILTQSNLNDEDFIINAVNTFGSSTVSFLLNIEKNFLNRYRLKHLELSSSKYSISQLLDKINFFNVGELLVQNVDREGCINGFDFNILETFSELENIPIVFSGGINSFEQCKRLSTYRNISGAGVGANFVFYGPHRAVLIDYFSKDEILEIFNSRI
jgi:cyclase